MLWRSKGSKYADFNKNNPRHNTKGNVPSWKIEQVLLGPLTVRPAIFERLSGFIESDGTMNERDREGCFPERSIDTNTCPNLETGDLQLVPRDPAIRLHELRQCLDISSCSMAVQGADRVILCRGKLEQLRMRPSDFRGSRDDRRSVRCGLNNTTAEVLIPASGLFNRFRKNFRREVNISVQPTGTVES